MNPRFLIPLLCIGAVVFACGPRNRNEAAAPKRDAIAAIAAKEAATTAAPRVTTRKASPASAPTVSAHVYVHKTESSIRVAMQVINTTGKRLELRFPTGQTYDFVILDSLGREVWSWGSGRMFTQALRNRTLDGGETLELEETWKANLAPGRYVARGTLKSENFPITQSTEFTVDATTVAQRD